MLLLIAFLAGLIFLAGTKLTATLRGSDFPDFYCAARMVAEGNGHLLYDAAAQRQCQARYAGRVGTLYIHPPFESALYLTVSWLPLKYSYLLWFFLNLVFLAASMNRLTRPALVWDWQALFAVSLTLVPVLLCLGQGQDSLFLLLILTLSFHDLRRGHGFGAGCWLGTGLFKFQIVLPLVLVLVLGQRKNISGPLAKGFAVVAVILAGLSAAICGWPVFGEYPNFLLHLSAQPLAGIVPGAMANFRGLVDFFLHRGQPVWSVVAVSLLSAAAFMGALANWKHVPPAPQQDAAAGSGYRLNLAFAGTMMFALLASYHLNPHDLSLLLLPIYLLSRPLAESEAFPPVTKWMSVGLIGLLFLPPLHLWALQAGTYALIAVPELALFAILGIVMWRNRTARVNQGPV